MKLTFAPIRSDATLNLVRAGDVLTIDGEAFDFSALPPGATLPRAAIACGWIAGDVTRDTGGSLTVPLLLPHGPNAPVERRFSTLITLPADGPVALPTHDEETSA